MRQHRRRVAGALPALAAAMALGTCDTAGAGQPVRIAIIIDDLGYESEAGRRAIDLPGPVACAILPSTPRGRRLAAAAHAAGKEVLLHLPLQSIGDAGAQPPGTIELDTTRAEFAASFAASLKSVPHAIGVNSHRGSLLTQHPGHMAWLMEELRARQGLIFVDSYTTVNSVALKLARESGIPAVRRDVFLDPDREAGTLRREFRRLKRLARQRGMAAGIGHPYPETLAFLESELPGLADDGIELIPISRYVALKSGEAVAAGVEPGASAGIYSRHD